MDGKWADFSADERGGDLLSLYAAIHGLSMTRAAVQVAREQGLESVANVVTHAAGAQPVQAAPNPRPAPVAVVVQPDREGWQTVLPVPAGAPGPVFRHYHRPRSAAVHLLQERPRWQHLMDLAAVGRAAPAVCAQPRMASRPHRGAGGGRG